MGNRISGIRAAKIQPQGGQRKDERVPHLCETLWRGYACFEAHARNDPGLLPEGMEKAFRTQREQGSEEPASRLQLGHQIPRLPGAEPVCEGGPTAAGSARALCAPGKGLLGRVQRRKGTGQGLASCIPVHGCTTRGSLQAEMGRCGF